MTNTLGVFEAPTPTEPQEGDLLVWYIPQVPMKAFERRLPHREGDEEKELALAALLLDTIISFSIFEFENRIKPDYSDAAGISRFEDGEWCDLDEDEYLTESA